MSVPKTNFIQVNSEIQALKIIRKHLGRIYCPKCHKKHYIRKLPEGRYYCSKCRYKFSLKVLLGFKNSKLTYLKLLKAIYCFSQRKTLLTTMDVLEVSYPTTRLLYSKLRELLPKNKKILCGDIVVDECFVGKQKTNNQAMMIGGVNRQFTDLSLDIIKDREQDSLEGFLVNNVKVDSLITTDGWSAYDDIEWYGYGHQIDNHSKGQLKRSVPIERVWALFKTLIRRTYHHIWKEKLPEYMVEFEARFNHKEIISKPANLLTFLLQPCSNSLT